jgi:hypothetical protein
VLDFMAPEVGLEPTTLRLTGAFPTLQEAAILCTCVDCKGLIEIPSAVSCNESQEISIRTAIKTATTTHLRCHY